MANHSGPDRAHSLKKISEFEANSDKANFYLDMAASSAAGVAMASAYDLKTHGQAVDLAYAEITAALVLATATACYATEFTSEQADKGYRRWTESTGHRGMLAAHAVNAAIRSSSVSTSTTKSRSPVEHFLCVVWAEFLFLLDRVFNGPRTSHRRTALRLNSLIRFKLEMIMDDIIKAANASVLAANSAIDAAKATDKITVRLSTGWHMHYDANDIDRLYVASQAAFASSSAAAAVAATAAIHTFDPCRSLQASSAARNAMAASSDALAMQISILRMTCGKIDKEECLRKFPGRIGLHDWLTELELLGTKNFYYKTSRSFLDVHDMPFDTIINCHNFSTQLSRELSDGTTTVSTLSGACKECGEDGEGRDARESTDMSDASTVTVGASP